MRVQPLWPALNPFYDVGSGTKTDPVYLMCTLPWSVSSSPTVICHVVYCLHMVILVVLPKVRRNCITKSRCTFPTSK